MGSSAALVILVLCLASLRASNARLLSAHKAFGQDVAEEKIMAKELSDEISNPSNMKSFSDIIINGATSAGNGITKPFSDIHHQGQKGPTRSMLESIPQDTKEGFNIDRGIISHTLDGIDNMDYSRPHLRPPIHNVKP